MDQPQSLVPRVKVNTGIAHGLLGLTQPINTANDFVLAPLQRI
jgi:hypothetical protein